MLVAVLPVPPFWLAIEITIMCQLTQKPDWKTLEEVREYFNPDLALLGYLFTMSEPTINASTSLQILRQTYTQKVLRTVIPRNTDLRDAHFNKTDIYSFNPRAKAALAYEKLIREVFLPDLRPTKTDKQTYEEAA